MERGLGRTIAQLQGNPFYGLSIVVENTTPNLVTGNSDLSNWVTFLLVSTGLKLWLPSVRAWAQLGHLGCLAGPLSKVILTFLQAKQSHLPNQVTCPSSESEWGKGSRKDVDSEKGDSVGVASVMIYPNSLYNISKIYNLRFMESWDGDAEDADHNQDAIINNIYHFR